MTLGPSAAFVLFYQDNSGPAAAPTPPATEPWVDPDLVAAIGRLPSGQREVLVLLAFGELTPTEIAQVLGKVAGTVRGQLARARAALRQALGEAPGPEDHDD